MINEKMKSAGFERFGCDNWKNEKTKTVIISPVGTDVKTWSVWIGATRYTRDAVQKKEGFRKWRTALDWANKQTR